MLAERIEAISDRLGYRHTFRLEAGQLRAIAAEVRALEAEVASLKAELAADTQRHLDFVVETNQHMLALCGRNRELEARALEDKIAQAQRQPGIADLERLTETRGRWIRPGEEIDYQSLRDGDPPYIAGPESETLP